MIKFRVTAYHLNMRAEPAITADIVGTVSRDAAVDLIEVSDDQYWYRIRRADGVEGWSSHKFLASLAHETDIGDEAFPWMPVALRELGVKEYAGSADNPRIVEYLRSTTLSAQYSDNDETYWCSAFVNWGVERAGYEGTDSAWARTWANWGRAIDQPQRGCIVVFRRGDGGHVGFYAGESGDRINVLGGNQNNSVCYKDYKKADLIGYRVPY